MRQILFRGIDCITERWIYGGIVFEEADDALYGGEDIPLIKAIDDMEREVIPETVGEFTGIDAAGSNRHTDRGEIDTRIFEGDIVMFPRFPENGKFVVVFYEGSFYAVELEYYDKKDIKEIPRISTYWWGDNGNGVPAIIGNVHDTQKEKTI